MRTHSYAAILAGGALVLIAAAGGADAQQRAIKVALDATFAPHAMPKMGGGVEGFNVDMAEEIAKRMKAKLELTAAEWSGLIPGMQAGKFDFLAAPTTVTEERAKSMLFSEGYLNTDYQFLVRKDAPEFKKLEDLKGRTISVNKGNVYDQWARERIATYGWNVESYATQVDAVQAVIAGRADLSLSGDTSIAWAAKQNPQLKLSFAVETGRVWAIPFRKDAVELRREVENVVECMKLDGTFAKLNEKWLGVAPRPRAVATTVVMGYGEPGFTGYDPTPHTPKCN
ncbi:MAG: transporter substrate-binding domain-containing protein [Proteobacteria bacterium]|nr:transporter substrate-binding domain-containing protein [Pseudomonadota bacterium]